MKKLIFIIVLILFLLNACCIPQRPSQVLSFNQEIYLKVTSENNTRAISITASQKNQLLKRFYQSKSFCFAIPGATPPLYLLEIDSCTIGIYPRAIRCLGKYYRSSLYRYCKRLNKD